MIQRLRKVTDQLFRGSAPSPKDVLWLKDNLNINKIVSLDLQTGMNINRAAQMLNIKHIMLPIDISNLRSSLLNFVQQDLKKLFLDDGPTYVHCAQGKDRTGLAIALLKCKYMGMSPEKAIQEAKSLGFGIGVDSNIIDIFEKLIRSSKPIEDTNEADIVSNEREYKSDNRDSYLDEAQQSSFAPYLNQTKQYPADYVYNFINEQSPTRENYEDYKTVKKLKENNSDSIPLVGIYNNDSGIHGAGPTEPVGGFIYD